MEIQIIHAALNNLSDIQKLNKELCTKENREFDATILEDYPFRKSGKEYFENRIKDGCALIVVDGTKIVGYLVGGLSEKEDFRKVPLMAEAENMFVLEDYRGKGIGKNLINEFLKWCKSKNVSRIRVSASIKNSRAIEFYKREGFQEYLLVLEKEM